MVLITYWCSHFIVVMEFANDVILAAGNPPKVYESHPRDETFNSAMEQSVILTTGKNYACAVIISMYM